MSSENILDKIRALSELSGKDTIKQKQIIAAAIKMFVQKGYANTSTSEIAKEAGVAEVTIFRNYGSKENLLFAIVLPFLKDLAPMLAHEFSEVIEQNAYNFETFIRAVVHNRYNFLKNNSEVFQVVFKEFLYRDDLKKELISYFSQFVTKSIIPIFDQFKATGQIVELPNSELIRMIIVTLIGNFTTLLFLQPGGSPTNDEAELEHLVQFIVNGLKK